MANRRPPQLLHWIATAISFAVFVLGAGFVYERLWNVPDVIYSALPSYRLERQSLSALTVENDGRATAHDVLVDVGPLDKTISQITLEGKAEVWDLIDGGDGADYFVVGSDRLAPGSQLTIYVLLENASNISVEDIEVTYEEGRGHPPRGASRLEREILGSVLSGALMFSAAWAILRFLRARGIREVILNLGEDT